MGDMDLMARARKPTEARKSERIIIRVSEDQKRVLTKAAEREGLDVSTWLRSLGLRAAAAGRV
jgi:uncharacterized protein (DUF1778 family)